MLTANLVHECQEHREIEHQYIFSIDHITDHVLKDEDKDVQVIVQEKYLD